MSRDGQHILKRTGPRPGAAYNLATTGAKVGLKRAAREINIGQAIDRKRVRKQPGNTCSLLAAPKDDALLGAVPYDARPAACFRKATIPAADEGIHA